MTGEKNAVPMRRSDLFDSLPWDVTELNHWLCLYVLETQPSDGKKYPVSSLYALLSGILHHMRSVDPDCPNFLDTNNHKFRELHAALDNLGRQLCSEGVGAEIKHASVISTEEEEALWEQGILSCDNPTSLLRYLNGKNFCLRGGSEHRNLKLFQLQRSSNPDQYLYTENGSKNRSGRLSERSVAKKNMSQYFLHTSRLVSGVSIGCIYRQDAPDGKGVGLFLSTATGLNT